MGEGKKRMGLGLTPNTRAASRQSSMNIARNSRAVLACAASRPTSSPCRMASTWHLNPTHLSPAKESNSGTWYNPTPSSSFAKSPSFNKPIKPARVELSSHPPRSAHCPGFYSFFKDLENGFTDIPWPKESETNFHSDFLNGFQYIPNYITQEEHDKFLHEALDYAHKYPRKVSHFDGRLVLNEMDTDFYPLFFNRLRKDGIMMNSERLPPNIYGPGDGIPAHFDNIVHVKGAVCSIGLGGSDVIKFENTRTGETREFTVEPRSLYIMTLHSRYSCVHFIEPKERKVPRISLVGCDMYRPPIVEPDLGLTEFKDFVMMGSYGVWRHLDEVRGHTTLRQKVDLLTQFAQKHFSKQLPFFQGRFEEMAKFAEQHNI